VERKVLSLAYCLFEASGTEGSPFLGENIMTLTSDLSAAEQELITQLRAVQSTLETDASADEVAAEQILADAKASGSALWAALTNAVEAAKKA
jgi:hypothetical protein